MGSGVAGSRPYCHSADQNESADAHNEPSADPRKAVDFSAVGGEVGQGVAIDRILGVDLVVITRARRSRRSAGNRMRAIVGGGRAVPDGDADPDYEDAEDG